MVNADKPDVYSLLKRGIIKDERDLLDNPCLNIKIGTEILYNHFSRCGVTCSNKTGLIMQVLQWITKKTAICPKIYIVYTKA